MSPLNDELRNLLAARADQVAPSPDPLAGIETRARRMRRNRFVGAAMASVIVLGGVGLAVPSLLPDRDSGSTQFATQQPSATQGQPISSWPARGNATPEALSFAKTAYATSVGVGPGQVFVRLLWGGSPDTGPQVLICLAGSVNSAGTQTPRDVITVRYAEDGVKKLVDSRPLEDGAREITRSVDLDGGVYIVAVGEPGTTEIAYAKDGGDNFAVQQQTEGVATFPRTGPAGSDPQWVRYTFGNGDQKTVDAERPAQSAQDYTLDPARPWAYRGSDVALGSGMLTTMSAQWSTLHPGSNLKPLFGQVYEPSGKHEVAFVATGGGADRWGYASSEEGGPAFFVDQELKSGTTALLAALPGDEVPRLFVLAAPNVGEIAYAKDYRTFSRVVGPEPGVAYQPLEGDTSKDGVRVIDSSRNLTKPVFLGPAPDASTAPANALDWAPRGGTPDKATMALATTAFVQADPRETGAVGTRVLYAGTTSDGRPYVYLQAWKGSNPAHLVGFQSDGQGAGTPFYGPVIGPTPTMLGALVSGSGGKSLLVLLPRPGVGQVSYSPDDKAPFRAVASGRSDTNPVGLVDRDPRAMNDRYQVKAADGSVLQTGSVSMLLCGASGCG